MCIVINMYNYKATITKITDGDTVHASVDVGFHMTVNIVLRLNGIDTPEIFRPINEAEKKHGMEAKQFLVDWILGKQVVIDTHKTGKYGRWIADICVHDVDVVQELAANGFEKRTEY